MPSEDRLEVRAAGSTRRTPQRQRLNEAVLHVLRALGLAVIAVGSHGVILVGPDKSDLKEVSLWFNRLTGRLESSEDDDFYVPVPGEPKRRKTALATVVKHALSAIK